MNQPNAPQDTPTGKSWGQIMAPRVHPSRLARAEKVYADLAGMVNPAIEPAVSDDTLEWMNSIRQELAEISVEQNYEKRTSRQLEQIRTGLYLTGMQSLTSFSIDFLSDLIDWVNDAEKRGVLAADEYHNSPLKDLYAAAKLIFQTAVQMQALGAECYLMGLRSEDSFFAEQQAKLDAPDTREYPKAGYIYLVSAETIGLTKIGRTTNVKQRFRNLQTQGGLALELVSAVEVGDAYAVEAELHQVFADKRTVGEWFALSAADIKKAQKRLKAQAIRWAQV